MAAPNTAPTQRDILRQSFQARQILLQTAPRARKNLGTTNLTVGQSSRIKLLNVGILTSIDLVVTAPLTIGTAIATGSPRAPYNLLSRVRLTDYDGTDRVSVTGDELYIINSIRNRAPFGRNNTSAIAAGIVASPNVPTAVADGTMRFVLNVPLAYDPESDLRGAIAAQTVVGEMYLTLDVNGSLVTNGSDDAVYNGAATSTVAVTAGQSIQVAVFQNYLIPQAVGASVPMPVVDLATVYELIGAQRTTDNIAANQEKLFAYPNYRTVIGSYFQYQTNGVLSNAWGPVRLIANGNLVVRENNNVLQNIEQRLLTNGDLMTGLVLMNHRNKPIETALLGNIQLGITPTTVSGGNQYFTQAYESFYTKGSVLPGLSQSA